MRFLFVFCLSLCAGGVLAGDSPLFTSPAIPLAQAAVGPGVDIIWGDTVRSGEPRFDEMLAMDGIQSQIAALDSLGYTLSLEQSFLNECRASKPGSDDTSDVECLQLNFDNSSAASSRAQLLLVRVPSRGFTSPPLAYIESYVDPGDSTYMKMPVGVDPDGNDRYIWMKYLVPETSEPTTE